MRLEELDFELPEEAIAQEPTSPRDACRLMYLPGAGAPVHSVFSDLPDLLRPGDLLVFNDSKVLPARVRARRSSGAEVELLFLHLLDGATEERGETWEALVRPSKRVRPDEALSVGDEAYVTLGDYVGDGRWAVSSAPGVSMTELMEAHGRLPLPPYIKEYPREAGQYQTVYARVEGSAAAPTAGLHFTDELLGRLRDFGVGTAEVTLHVGLDTFLPIRESTVEDHAIHTERYEVTAASMRAVADAKAAGKQVVAVGTTSVRVLETLARDGLLDGRSFDSAGAQGGVEGATDIFITPGYEFRAVDLLLTNFHLPRSSVLALTMAFAGVERIRLSYEEALRLGYRFFSFGDAMLIEGVSRGGRSVG